LRDNTNMIINWGVDGNMKGVEGTQIVTKPTIGPALADISPSDFETR